jgi:hypothetical protein
LDPIKPFCFEGGTETAFVFIRTGFVADIKFHVIGIQVKCML